MKKFFPKIKLIICMLMCVAACIAFPLMAFASKGNDTAVEESVIHIWQIDSFEGGKGSRADFLQKIGEEFSLKSNCYVSVISLSADAARLNLKEGNVPDAISYGAGMYGIESYINSFQSWCHGGYCFLTLDSSSDFSDINTDNTIINEGKDNLSGAAALLCGLQNATYEKPTSAYVKLINGDYKYLLGTQRDIYRLKTRGVGFGVKPITTFNDLYQNISVIEKGDNCKITQSFVDFLLTKINTVSKLGLMCEKVGAFDDEMKLMEGVTYEYKLTAPITLETKNNIKNIISSGDINMLKNLFK